VAASIPQLPTAGAIRSIPGCTKRMIEDVISIPWTPRSSLRMPSGFMGMLEASLEIQEGCFMSLGTYL
jgi:hypothetical protein